MDRRSVLKHIGGAGAVGALAGCVGVQEQGSTDTSGGDGSGGSTEGTETTGPTGTAKAWFALPKTEVPMRKSLISSFNERSRHTINESDIADIKKKMKTAIPAGQGPATFDFAHDLVGQYYQNGFVVDQSDELSVSLDKFTSAAASAVQFDGATVGLPYSAETVSLIYNTDIVDEAPSTVSDVVSVMKEYHDPANGKYGLSYPINPYFVSGWLQAFGGYYFDASKDDALGVNKPATVEGLTFLLNNFRPYMPKDPKYGAQTSPFSGGNAAFAINGPWYLSTLNEKGVNYSVTTLPTPEGGEPNPYTGIRMWYFAKGMKESESSAAAARTFAEWAVTNEDHIVEKANKQGAIPVLKSAMGRDELPEDVKAYSRVVKQGIPMPTHPKMQAVWAAMRPALRAAFTGSKSPQKALDDAATNVRNNWK